MVQSICKKKKWGVANTGQYKIILIPYSPFSVKYVPDATESDLVGIIMQDEEKTEQV